MKINLSQQCAVCYHMLAAHTLFMDKKTRKLDMTKAIICPNGAGRTSWAEALGAGGDDDEAA